MARFQSLMRPMRLVIAAAVAAGVCSAAVGTPLSEAQQAVGTAEAAAAKPKFIRVVELDGGMRVRMEVVIRQFEPGDGRGPAVDLVGAAHIGDQSFYEALQAHLDGKDVVLFEGVKPAGAGAALDAEATDQERAEKTIKRIRLIAAVAEAYKAEKGEYPDSIERLTGARDQRIASLVKSVALDGWGNAIVYTLAPDSARGFELVSFGADGAEGGDGFAADIRYSQEPPLREDEKLSDGRGIQSQLASALGLKFQLDVMDHSGKNWRNSDMSIDQLQRRLEEAGVSGAPLFKMLDGSSLNARLLGVFLGFVKRDPSLAAMCKLMLAETLSDADQLLGEMPGEMGTLMDVIVNERNAVVIEDLRRIVRDEPEVKTVGILYGAGHLPGLQKSLEEELGYRQMGEKWVPAIEVDLKAAGLSLKQASQMRAVIRNAMQHQLRMLERQRQREAAKGKGKSGESE